MKYVLKTMVLGRTPDISISADRFKLLKEAKKTLSEAFAIEEKYELLLSNFLELHKEPLALASENMLRQRFDYAGFFDIRLAMNRKIVNLVTSTKLYLDHLLAHTKHFASSGENIEDIIRAYISEEYDGHFEYRFMEALRNHVQHKGLAVHLTPIGGNAKSYDETRLLEHSVSAYSVKKYLEENRKFKKSVLNEMPEKVELLWASKI